MEVHARQHLIWMPSLGAQSRSSRLKPSSSAGAHTTEPASSSTGRGTPIDLPPGKIPGANLKRTICGSLIPRWQPLLALACLSNLQSPSLVPPQAMGTQVSTPPLGPASPASTESLIYHTLEELILSPMVAGPPQTQ